jgi:hypothetical protein
MWEICVLYLFVEFDYKKRTIILLFVEEENITEFSKGMVQGARCRKLLYAL